MKFIVEINMPEDIYDNAEEQAIAEEEFMRESLEDIKRYVKITKVPEDAK